MTTVPRLFLAAALAAAILACGRPSRTADDGGMVTIKGSDTMVHLVSSWAEEFMASHPDVDISVSGGGSGTGVKAFINGTTDIAAASRDLDEEERKSAVEQGRAPQAVAVAMDGIAVIVHPQNPITEITLEQLKKIYTGAYTNWSEVGVPAAPFVVYSRESSSGTYVFFQEHVLGKENYAANVRLMPATAGIIQSVAEDRGAIGYVGLGYAAKAGDKVKVVNVKADADAPAVAPSEETVKSGAYSIARPLYLITAENPAGSVKIFLDFALSDEGQEVVRSNDYITVR